MIGQYLSHTNKRVTVAILQNISKVNKAILSSIHMCMWMHACTSCHVFSDACMHSSREDECQKCHVFSEAVARRRDLCNRKVDANLWRQGAQFVQRRKRYRYFSTVFEIEFV